MWKQLHDFAGEPMTVAVDAGSTYTVTCEHGKMHVYAENARLGSGLLAAVEGPGQTTFIVPQMVTHVTLWFDAADYLYAPQLYLGPALPKNLVSR